MIVNWNNRMREYFSKIVILALNFLALVLFGCYSECGDLFNKSPSDLYANNDHVVLAEWIRTDTLLYLGTFESYESDMRFVIIEYGFKVNQTFKGIRQNHNVYLWNCEYISIEDGYSSIANIAPNEIRLVYGKTLSDHNSIGNVLLPQMAIIETVDLETNLKSILIASDTLQTIMDTRIKTGTIIYGTDEYLVTFDDFASGQLCYYDSKGAARKVTAQEYAEELWRIAQSNAK